MILTMACLVWARPALARDGDFEEKLCNRAIRQAPVWDDEVGGVRSEQAARERAAVTKRCFQKWRSLGELFVVRLAGNILSPEIAGTLYEIETGRVRILPADAD